jgi:hypothetical protein
MPANDFLRLLERLVGARVEFTVVGGTAAVLHGGSLATYDLDVLMPFTRENCERLLEAMAGVHPRLAHTVDKRPLQLTADALSELKNLYLLTDLGRLDVLGSLPPFPDVQAVLEGSERMRVGDLEVRVLSLDALIEVKAALGRPQDRIAEAELRAIADARKGKR